MQKTDYYKIAFFALLAAVVAGGAVYLMIGNRDASVDEDFEMGELKSSEIKGGGKEFYDSGSGSEGVGGVDKPEDSVGNVLHYVNEEYGFRLSLPFDWKGYQVERGKDFDNSLETLRFSFSEDGPLFSVHVFTVSQWKQATNEGADGYMMGRKLGASEEYVFMWEQASDAPSAETAKYYKDLEKIKGSFKLGSIPANQVMEWKKHVSHIGITLKYPNDGNYSIKQKDSDSFFIANDNHPGRTFFKRYDHGCDSVDVPRRDSDEKKEFNGETYNSFFRIGMGDPYGYYVEKNGKCYVFSSLGGPENETFEAIMETVEFN